MKFKVGDKIRMLRNEDEAEAGDIGIVKICVGDPWLYFVCFSESGEGGMAE